MNLQTQRDIDYLHHVLSSEIQGLNEEIKNEMMPDYVARMRVDNLIQHYTNQWGDAVNVDYSIRNRVFHFDLNIDLSKLSNILPQIEISGIIEETKATAPTETPLPIYKPQPEYIETEPAFVCGPEHEPVKFERGIECD